MTEPLKTLGAILDELAAARPEESLLTTAMNSGATETVSRHELKRWSDNLAQALLDLGVMTGDLVPIHLPTCNQFLVAAVAIFKAGGTPMPVSSKLPPAELMGLIDLAQPKVIISHQRFDQTTLNPDSYSDKEPISAALPHRVSNPIKAFGVGRVNRQTETYSYHWRCAFRSGESHHSSAYAFRAR
jgi:bile acid-coenzyme A ligase